MFKDLKSDISYIDSLFNDLISEHNIDDDNTDSILDSISEAYSEIDYLEKKVEEIIDDYNEIHKMLSVSKVFYLILQTVVLDHPELEIDPNDEIMMANGIKEYLLAYADVVKDDSK